MHPSGSRSAHKVADPCWLRPVLGRSTPCEHCRSGVPAARSRRRDSTGRPRGWNLPRIGNRTVKASRVRSSPHGSPVGIRAWSSCASGWFRGASGGRALGIVPVCLVGDRTARTGQWPGGGGALRRVGLEQGLLPLKLDLFRRVVQRHPRSIHGPLAAVAEPDAGTILLPATRHEDATTLWTSARRAAATSGSLTGRRSR